MQRHQLDVNVHIIAYHGSYIYYRKKPTGNACRGFRHRAPNDDAISSKTVKL